MKSLFLLSAFLCPLVFADYTLYKLVLTGEQETHSVETDAVGYATLVASKDLGELSVFLTHDVQNVTAAHIHEGAPGQDGGVVFDLGDGTSPIQTIIDLTDREYETLAGGNYYINVHSEAVPAGEIRAQIVGGVAPDLYEVTVTNVTKGQPFSPPLIVAHNDGERLFQAGSPASDGLAALAEDGDNMPLMTSLTANPNVFHVATCDPVPPGGSVTIEIFAYGAMRRISVLGMLVNTNDAFFAADSLRVRNPTLFKRNLFAEGTQVMAFAYDAGSEANDEDCGFIPGPACGSAGVRATEGAEGYVHVHNGIQGTADLGSAAYDWRGPVAVIHIERSE